MLGEAEKAAGMVREGRAAPAPGRLRYTAPAGPHENSGGSGRAHGRLSSAAADGHVYGPRDATPFVQRVLGRPPVAPSRRRPPPRLPARRTMDKLSRSRGDAVFAGNDRWNAILFVQRRCYSRIGFSRDTRIPRRRNSRERGEDDPS